MEHEDKLKSLLENLIADGIIIKKYETLPNFPRKTMKLVRELWEFVFSLRSVIQSCKRPQIQGSEAAILRRFGPDAMMAQLGTWPETVENGGLRRLTIAIKILRAEIFGNDFERCLRAVGIVETEYNQTYARMNEYLKEFVKVHGES